jgi:hypothetical protein
MVETAKLAAVDGERVDHQDIDRDDTSPPSWASPPVIFPG